MEIAKTLLQDQIAAALRQAIISGEMKPGERVVEADLAAQLGVSRAPLREAIKQLVAEGLLTNEPWKGASVVKLGQKDLWEIFSLRRALEGLAVEILTEARDPKHLKQLSAIVDEMRRAVAQRDLVALVDLDMGIHQTLCELSGHSRLYEVWMRMNRQLRIFFATAERLYEDWEIIERHERLLEAIASGDRARAVAEISEHVQNGAHRLQQILHVEEES